MALLKFYRFNNIFAMQTHLTGGLIGADVSKGIVGLVGLTLTFANPAGSLVFATAGREQDKLLFADLKTQIETAIPTLKVSTFEGRIAFVEVTPTNGVSFPATAQQAKALLGFDSNTALGGKVYSKPGGVAPSLEITYYADGAHILVTSE